MNPDLEALLKLQERDQAILAIEAEQKALEPELQTLDAELAKAQAELEAARQAAREADQRRAELEGKIESYRIMQERRRQRLEWVRGAKEASTLMAELDLARTVLAKEEAEWIRSADRVQEAERRVQELEQVLEQVRQAQGPLRETLAAKQGELAERLAAARKEREQAARNVRKDLLAQYERIRRGRAPMALYPLHEGACGNCFTAVPIHRRHAIQDGQSITHCEACGVMLYHVAA